MAVVGIIGDSQGEGLVPTLVPLLEAKGMRVAGVYVQRGMSLQNMRAMSWRAVSARAVASVSTDALIVILGGNNRLSRIEEYSEEVRWFLREVAGRPRQIWWIGPAATATPGVEDPHRRTGLLQKAIFDGSRKVAWLDGWSMTSRGVQFAPDGLHFTRAGYATWARRLADALPPGTPLGLLIGAALGRPTRTGAITPWPR